MSEETKQKISAALTGRKLSDSHRRQLSEAHKGKPRPESTNRKLSDLYKGRKLPPLAYANALRATAKTYLLIGPDGEESQVTNMRAHCRNHNLSPFKMSEVVNGRRRAHKGWSGRHAPD